MSKCVAWYQKIFIIFIYILFKLTFEKHCNVLYYIVIIYKTLIEFDIWLYFHNPFICLVYAGLKSSTCWKEQFISVWRTILFTLQQLIKNDSFKQINWLILYCRKKKESQSFIHLTACNKVHFVKVAATPSPDVSFRTLINHNELVYIFGLHTVCITEKKTGIMNSLVNIFEKLRT